jgi:hypothetical protein
MDKLFKSVLFIFLISTKSVAQTDYFVGFFGEGIGISAPVGHAFIGIGRGIPLTCDLNGSETEMVGFYPKVRIEGGKSILFGPVDSQVKDDVRTTINSYAFKKITFDQYLRAKLKIEQWKTRKYELTRNDCISFFIDVASIFPDTKLPDRTQFVTPDAYVRQFIFLNKLLK